MFKKNIYYKLLFRFYITANFWMLLYCQSIFLIKKKNCNLLDHEEIFFLIHKFIAIRHLRQSKVFSKKLMALRWQVNSPLQFLLAFISIWIESIASVSAPPIVNASWLFISQRLVNFTTQLQINILWEIQTILAMYLSGNS